MSSMHRLSLIAALAMLAVACVDPSGATPGMKLSGEEQGAFPDDWSFVSDIPEIALEVQTPYFLRHSVTIWCVSVGGDLFVAALDPESKNWPGWVQRDPNVRLAIAGKIYPATLNQLQDRAQIQEIAETYAGKYNRTLPEPGGEVPGIRYWQVLPRS